MFKNATPIQIALLSASSIAGVLFIVLSILIATAMIDMPYGVAFLIALSLLILGYFIFFYFLKQYIYRKIKVIYKSIHSGKNSAPNIEELNFDGNIIDEVEKEVAQWADTQQKEIEKLKLLEEYRRNFLGDISHELKTPLFNVQGYIHTLLDGALYDENINRNYLKRAASNAERLHNIVEDLDVISRLETGENPISVEDFNIRKLAVEVMEENEFLAQERNIQISFKEGIDKPFQVKADREAIRQVFTNLIVNSIKYGNEGGYTKIGFYDMEDYILVEIADNGIGIDKKDMARVFDRFYRVEKSRNRKAGGSGLGLSIVKHIIEAHKQTINVRSTMNVGSTFGFTLEKS